MCQFHSRLTTRAPSADRLLQNLQVRLCILLETSPETVQETFPFPPKPHWSVRCLSVSVDPFKKSWGLASFHSYSAQLTLFSAVVLKCSVFHFLKRYFKKKAPFSPQFYLSLNNNNNKNPSQNLKCWERVEWEGFLRCELSQVTKIKLTREVTS